jgi:hypothetical protein
MEEKKDEGEEIFSSWAPMVLLFKKKSKIMFMNIKKLKNYLDVANYLSRKPIKNMFKYLIV